MDPNRINTKKDGDREPISVHRAFVYSALGPGWGEVYSGCRWQGYMTATVFTVFFIWFNWIIVEIFIDIYMNLVGSINGDHAGDLNIPYQGLGLSILGAVFTWSWGVISAVNLASIKRSLAGDPVQNSEIWALAMSWCCPGAGQVYAGKKQAGRLIFVLYLVAILFLLPVFARLGNSIMDAAAGGRFSSYDPIAMAGVVRDLVFRVKYSIPNQVLILLRYLVFAGTILALHGLSLRRKNIDPFQPPPLPDRLNTHSHWIRRSAGYFFALLIVGWICPGAGQLLQKRYVPGWIFFFAFFGSMFLTALLLGAGAIQTESIVRLSWLFTGIKLFAVLEAPLRMKGWE